MKPVTKMAVLGFGIAIAFSTLAAGQPTSGSIVGFVLDFDGQPLAQATVTARSIGHGSSETRVSVKTDNTGHFVISDCPFGAYVVLMTREHGRRTGVHAIFAGSPVVTTVMLSAGLPSASISFKLGRDTAIVSGTIKDGLTARPINARINLKSSGSSSYWLVTGLPPEFRIQVPATGDISIALTAPGYQTWYSGQPPTFSLRLGPGTKKSLNVLMQPIPQ